MSLRNLSMTLLAVLLLAACSDDDRPAAEELRQGNIVFAASSRQGGVVWMDGRSKSRAENTIESVMPQTLGIFAFGDGQNTTYVFKNQRVYNEDNPVFRLSDTETKFAWNHTYYPDPTDLSKEEANPWPYTTDEDENASVQRPWEKMHYKFFAYSPWYETEHVSVTGENYSMFNTFRWEKVPGFTGDDFILAHRIEDVDNTGGLRQTKQAVHFEMRHILSRIRFFFKMSPAYRTIRRIEINSLTVLTAGKVQSATFNFKSNVWDGAAAWEDEQIGDADPVTLFSEEGLTYAVEALGKDDVTGKEIWPPNPFASVYVYPQDNFNSLKMQVNYTVYDSKNVKTREAKVINTIEISPAWTLKAGYYYDIKINIVPDYLYVLSDNDQDFDGWVIIKDN